jgi:hypothetical protein
VAVRSNAPLVQRDRGLGSDVDLDVYLRPFCVCVVLRRKGLCDGPSPRPKGFTQNLQTIIIILSKETRKSKHKELFREKNTEISELLF